MASATEKLMGGDGRPTLLQDDGSGVGSQAAIGIVKLLGMAQDIVHNSTAHEAAGFDAVKWLETWIERPQAALGGRKPADLLDTPAGLEVVGRLLGAIESGACQ